MTAESVDLARLRQEYADHGLDEADLADDPVVQFRSWLAEAIAAGLHEPNAMVLSTVSDRGQPSSRMVLLKGVDDGFVLFTNLDSRKGAELAANPVCALLFPWHPVQRQVRVTGVAAPLARDEVEAYFSARPRGAQIGAWASPQSMPVDSRDALAQAYVEAEARFTDAEVPAPPHWGGYRVSPTTVEFWQGRSDRMHDRVEYVRRTDPGSGWERRRLAP